MAPARDVLVACAQVAVSRGITALPADIEDETAVSMLELTAAQPASGSPGTAGGSAPPVAYASSAAFDRDEDAATLSAIALLMALAHPAAGVVPPEDLPADSEDWPASCPECGSDDPQGTYGCECWNPAACRRWGLRRGGHGIPHGSIRPGPPRPTRPGSRDVMRQHTGS